jgi:hypothetical protein
MVARRNGNRYQVVFMNSAGTAPTTAATLTVNPAPSPTVNFNSGFAVATTLTLNGGLRSAALVCV